MPYWKFSSSSHSCGEIREQTAEQHPWAASCWRTHQGGFLLTHWWMVSLTTGPSPSLRVSSSKLQKNISSHTHLVVSSHADSLDFLCPCLCLNSNTTEVNRVQYSFARVADRIEKLHLKNSTAMCLPRANVQVSPDFHWNYFLQKK